MENVIVESYPEELKEWEDFSTFSTKTFYQLKSKQIITAYKVLQKPSTEWMP